MTVKKRFFCAILSLVLMLGMLPTASLGVSAEAGSGAAASVSIDGSTTEFTDLSAAFAAAADAVGNQVILTLLQNVSTTEVISVLGGSFTVDLHGKTWTAADSALALRGTVDLTILDSTDGAAGKIMASNYAINTNNSQATHASLTIAGGTLISENNYTINANCSTITLRGGKLESPTANICHYAAFIDLSEHPDPTGISVLNTTGAELVPGDSTIKLPAHFAFYFESTADLDEQPVTSLQNSLTYIIMADVLYPLWIGEKRVTSANTSDVFGDGLVSYDPETNTLSLGGLILDSTGTEISSEMYAAVYHAGSETLTLFLSGENVVTPQTTDTTLSSYGIYSNSGITVSADSTGTLTLTSGKITQSDGYNSYGIYIATPDCDLTVLGGSLTVTAGEVTSELGESLGIYTAGTCTVSGGTLHASGGSAATSYGIYAVNGANILGGLLVATGETQSFSSAPTVSGSMMLCDENGNRLDEDNPHLRTYLKITAIPTATVSLLLRAVDSEGTTISGSFYGTLDDTGSQLSNTAPCEVSDLLLGNCFISYTEVPQGYLCPSYATCLTVTDTDGDGLGEVSCEDTGITISTEEIDGKTVYIVTVTLETDAGNENGDTSFLSLMLKIVDSENTAIDGYLTAPLMSIDAQEDEPPIASLDTGSPTNIGTRLLGTYIVSFADNMPPYGYLLPNEVCLTFTDTDGDGLGEVSCEDISVTISTEEIDGMTVYIVTVTLQVCTEHLDEDGDGWCDTCGGCTEHYDEDSNGLCDLCTECIEHCFDNYYDMGSEGHCPICIYCSELDTENLQAHEPSDDGYYCTLCYASLCTVEITDENGNQINPGDTVDLGAVLTATLYDSERNVIPGAVYDWNICFEDTTTHLSTSASYTVTAQDRNRSNTYLYLNVMHPVESDDETRITLAYVELLYAPAATITGASLSIGQDLTMKYYVETAQDLTLGEGQRLGMQFTMSDKTTLVTDYTTVDGELVFAFTGISPQCMVDRINATLVLLDADDTALGALAYKGDYSIRDYAGELYLAENVSDELKQLIVDLLTYGTAAQHYKEYVTPDGYASGIFGSEAPPSEALPDESDNVKHLETADGVTLGEVKFKSATVRFDYVNKIGVRLNAYTENTRLVIKRGTTTVATHENLSADMIYTDAIYATDFDTVYTFALYEGDTLLQTLTYSVSSYVYVMMDKTDENENLTPMASLARALYRYGASAIAYQATQSTEE